MSRVNKKIPVTAPANSIQTRFSRRARFAVEYTVDGNGMQAATRAGYPPTRAGKVADRLLRRPEIKAEVAERARRRFDRAGLKTDDVLREMRRAAYARMRTLYRDDGTFKTIAEMDKDALGGLEWLDLAPDGLTVVGIQPLDKIEALKLLGRHYRLFGRHAEDPGDERALLALIAEGLKRAP